MASTDDVVRATGITYRRLDYWVRKGLITPETGSGGQNRGKDRVWSERDIQIATLLAKIADSGVTVEVAAKVARLIVDNPKERETRSVRVGDNVWITVKL